MAQILDGKACAAEVLAEAQAWAARLPRAPKLAVIQVGHDPASDVYVRQKTRACVQAGVHVSPVTVTENVDAPTLMGVIRALNNAKDVDGILLQLPLPRNLDKLRQAIIDTIDPDKDVDGLTTESQGRLMTGRQGFVPCTPAGIMELLKRNNVQIEGRDVTIIGRSTLVGKPLALLMQAAGATVTVCHRQTRSLDAAVAWADILVSATGCPHSIGPSPLMHDADKVLVDVGITRMPDGTLAGDIDPAFYGYVGAYTPVPGGVGPMTVAMLVKNAVRAAEMRQE